MRIKYLLPIIMCFVAQIMSAQTITFHLPKSVHKTYSFAIFNGLQMDTIAKGNISMVGDGKIVIPDKYKDIPLTGVLEVNGRDPMTLIVNNGDFSFEDLGDKLSFNGSLENDLLYNKKNEVMDESYRSTYAQAYMKTMNAVMQIYGVLNRQGATNLFEKNKARLSALNDVDMDKLYYGKYWFFIIDGLMQLSTGQEGYANDMIRLLDKMESDAVYVAFVKDLIMITNQYGMDDAFDIIIPHVQQMGRIEYPQGSVYDAFAMAKVRKGVKAPKVAGLKEQKTKAKYTLLIFHQPDCDSCHKQLGELKQKYPFLVNKDVRIVTISGAMNEKSFMHESEGFLWEDQLCDYKGFGGGNFLEFGIIGTPTLYLLDKDDMVLGRFAMIVDVEKYIITANE